MSRRSPLAWLRPAAWNTLRTARTSVVVTVAVLPSLLTQVMAFFASVSPLVWILIWAFVMVVVFAVFLYFEYRAQPREGSGAIESSLTAEQCERITQLVAVTSNMTRLDPLPVIKDLVRQLSGLRRVYAVTCEGDNAQQQVELLEQYVTSLHRTIEITDIHVHPKRHEFDEATVGMLASELGALPDRQGLVVDITQDNKVVTLSLYLAATRQGLPVTYVATRAGHGPGEEFHLQAIRDPQGLFATAPAPV